MSTRIRLDKAEPAGYRALAAMEQYLGTTRLTQTHKDLIKIRASQLNRCAFCIDMHTRDARKAGETEQRIYALNAWRETPFCTPRERAILVLTEDVTLISDKHVADTTYDQAAALFDEQYLSQILMCIIVINAWNRLGISTGLFPSDR